MSVPDSSAPTGTVVGRSTRKRRGHKTGVPYENANEEISKVLKRLDCKNIGFKPLDDTHEVLLEFERRGREIQLRVSAKGWAQAFLKKQPWSYRHRRSRVEYEQDALQQGHIAVHSMLRDWVKGSVTAIECGILSFDAVFLPFMLTHDGRPLIERVSELLPKPDEPKVVQIPHKPGA
jgi:hypothetical protein